MREDDPRPPWHESGPALAAVLVGGLGAGVGLVMAVAGLVDLAVTLFQGR